MTMTKTLVSLKSCRSVSEIETLPPSGYLASTVIQKSTYVNDDFVSDDEDTCYEESKYACRDICCKERFVFYQFLFIFSILTLSTAIGRC